MRTPPAILYNFHVAVIHARENIRTHTRAGRERERRERERETEVEGKEGLTREETETGRGWRVRETRALSQARARRHRHTRTPTNRAIQPTEYNKKNREKISETKLPESVTPTHNNTRPLYALLADERLDLLAKTSSQPLPRQILCVAQFFCVHAHTRTHTHTHM